MTLAATEFQFNCRPVAQQKKLFKLSNLMNRNVERLTYSIAKQP
jgi:hypothetical protein